MNHQQMVKPMLIGAGILAALAVAGVPVAAVIPLLFFLACPLMMIFMMRGMDHGHGGGCHGGHGSHDSHDEQGYAERERSERG